MTRLQALQAAKLRGYTKAIYCPYTYHPRTLQSHILEARQAEEDPDYYGSAAAKMNWKFDLNNARIESSDESDVYILVK